MIFDTECHVNRFLLGYAHTLVDEIDEQRLSEQPSPGVNHPAWILGHLAYSADGAVGVLGGQKTLAGDWTKKFGAGSKASSLRADYPSKAELLRVLEERFETARHLAAAASPETV